MNRMSSPARFALFTLCVAALCVAGCERSDKPASTLSQSQRDTVLSKSDIPGASAVGHAFDAAGKEANHAAELDSLVH